MRAGAEMGIEFLISRRRLQFTIVVRHVVRHQLYEPMALEQLVAKLQRQLVEQRQIQMLAGTAQTMLGLWRDQVSRVLARIHAAASQATNFLPQFR